MWQRKYPAYDFAHSALFKYDEAMKKWFEEYKFRGDYLLRYSFSKQITHYLKQKSDFLIVPIPLSEQRLKERGFNQVEGLLSGAGSNYCSCLIKKTDDLPQAKKGRQERLATKQPFELKAGSREIVEKRKILLVDDIYTTGRTLFHASELFLDQSLKKLETFSLAR